MMQAAKDSLDLGMIVSDIDKSREFYQDMLGLKFDGTMDLDFGTLYRYLFGTSVIKLIMPKEEPPGPGAIGLDKQLGFRYITFFVTNISELCAGLKDKGVEFVTEEMEFVPGKCIAMVKDPDGNMVEFVQAS
jgi:catechol 2,3-dioxygenase-like lactoylglutathione lyase family enzyme